MKDCPAHIGCSVSYAGKLVAGAVATRGQRLVKVASSEKCFAHGDELGLPVRLALYLTRTRTRTLTLTRTRTLTLT